MKSRRHIFKYLPFSSNSLKILINGELWLGLPKNLNDPFECEFLIKTYNSLPRKGIIEFIYNRNPELLNKKTLEEKILEISLDRNVFHTDFHFLLKKTLKEKYGVTSFSYVKDDILMWAHYADGNKGFCIVFDKYLLLETLKYPKEWINFNEVIYKPKLVEAELLIDKNSISFKNAKEILVSKLNVWKRENETRLFTIFPNSTASRSIKFDKKCIKGLIFGENMHVHDKETIKNLIKNDSAYSKVCFYNANKDFNKRKMQIIKE